MSTAVATFDHTATAALYSQLTGVLAGFAFTGFLIVATTLRLRHEPLRQDAIDRALVLLLSAFLGLTMSSLGYALLAGEEAAPGRAAVEHVIAGAGFGASSLVLLLAIVELLRAMAPNIEASARNVAGRYVPVVVLLYIALGANDVASTEGFTWSPLSIAAAIGVVLLAIVATAGWRIIATRMRDEVRYVGGIGLMIAVSAPAGVGLASSTLDPIEPATWPAWCAVLVSFIATTGFSVYCALTRDDTEVSRATLVKRASALSRAARTGQRRDRA